MQKIAARVPSSDFLYHEPRMKCAPTLHKADQINMYNLLFETETYYAIAENPPSNPFNKITCQAAVVLYVTRVRTLHVTLAMTKTYLGRKIVNMLVPGI